MDRRLALLSLAAVSGCTMRHDDHDGADAPRYVSWNKDFKFALVLSSGGPRGFVHVGVLKALQELRVQPDLIVGASVGALVGAMAASGMDAARMEKLALDLSPLEMGRLNLVGEGRLSGAAIASWVDEQLGGKPAQTLPIAFGAVAVGQTDRKPMLFNQGRVGPAVQASAAIEGQFSPVRIGGKTYVDADLVTPLPVRLARECGARKVLAIDASAHEKEAPAGAERFKDSDAKKRMLTEPDARAADLCLHPKFGYWVSLSREFRERAIAAGYADTLAAAKKIQALYAS
jgi:NTE family protein